MKLYVMVWTEKSVIVAFSCVVIFLTVVILIF